MIGKWLDKMNEKSIPIVLIMAYVFFGLLYLYQQSEILKLKYHPPIASANVTGLVNSYIEVMAQSNLSEQAAKANIKDFTIKLQRAIDMASHQDHVVIVPSQAVLSGSKDETQHILQLIKQQGN